MKPCTNLENNCGKLVTNWSLSIDYLKLKYCPKYSLDFKWMYCFSKLCRLFQVDALPRKLERMMRKNWGNWGFLRCGTWQCSRTLLVDIAAVSSDGDSPLSANDGACRGTFRRLSWRPCCVFCCHFVHASISVFPSCLWDDQYFHFLLLCKIAIR